MQWLAALFVGKPLNIAAVAACFVAAYGLSRVSRTPRRVGALLIAGSAWLLYAGWEWLVVSRTPEANIRVDLLVIWPVLAALSVWAGWQASRRVRTGPKM